MTIYEMLFREDIYGIMEKTLEQYFAEVCEQNVEVRIERSILKNKFVVYPRLGIAVSRCPSWKVAKDIFSQFNIQGNVVKKMIAWGYVASCFLTCGLMAKRSLYVSAPSLLNRHIYIMPCNRKIRVFNYKEGYVDVILKDSFNDNYFQNELKYRIQPQYSFIPALQKYGKRWYRESILKGVGLVRVAEPYYSECVTQAKNYLGQMYTDSVRYESCITYCKKLGDYINTYLPEIEKNKHIAESTYIKRIVERALYMVSESSMKVPIVMSHGDMQTGNIMYDKGTRGVFIYDWETAGQRSIWYDMGKFLLYSQRKGKYAYMVNHCEDEEIKNALLTFDEDKSRKMDEVMAVLVLEELVSFIDEIRDLPGRIGAEIMSRLTDELKQTNVYE